MGTVGRGIADDDGSSDQREGLGDRHTRVRDQPHSGIAAAAAGVRPHSYGEDFVAAVAIQVHIVVVGQLFSLS